MTHRERFLETLLFGAPDRIPFAPGGGRESTQCAWREQGCPPDREYMDVIFGLINKERSGRGLEPARFKPEKPVTDTGVSFRMIPTFEEKVLEHIDGHYIVQDWMGAITEISDEYDYTYIRNPIDFVTRKWHKFPVENHRDWEAMKARFDLRHPERFPADFQARCEMLRQRDYPLIINLNGPFWQLREFCGFEGLCAFLLTDPDFVHEMVQFWTEFCLATLKPILERITPDMVHFSEDMAFKEHPMISPEMTRAFCAPCYRAIAEETKGAGVPIIAMDSDGRVDLLIPVWLDCGITCVDPMEVAAGNDIVALRAHYGNRLAFQGGIDKRAIAAGGEVLKTELDRIRPVVESGGCIPGCDHGVPPDVSWAHYTDYCLQLAQMTGWLD
jgi:uroporphyrinogen decarboxylase